MFTLRSAEVILCQTDYMNAHLLHYSKHANYRANFASVVAMSFTDYIDPVTDYWLDIISRKKN